VLPLTSLPQGPRETLSHACLIGLIVALGWLLGAGVGLLEQVVNIRFDLAAADNLEARSVRTQVRGFRNVARFVIGVLSLSAVLMTFEGVRQLGVSLLASAGVAGIVIGFAAQRSIATVLAGIQIALTQPIRVDDVVIVEGEWGRIEEITLTYVVVKIWDLRRLVVPITYFIEQPFQNWTRVSAELLGSVFLHVDYKTPVEDVRKELARILEHSELWDRKVCSLVVTNASERTLELRALMSARDASALWDLRCHVREQLVGYLQRAHPACLPLVRAAVEHGAVEQPTSVT
jgi:small-conductance mechanosensitive channel